MVGSMGILILIKVHIFLTYSMIGMMLRCLLNKISQGAKIKLENDIKKDEEEKTIPRRHNDRRRFRKNVRNFSGDTRQY